MALNGDGIVYVATKQDRYMEEAFLSACSVKESSPDLGITLFTDSPNHAVCKMPVFERVIPVKDTAGVRHPWAAGQLIRILCLRDTPYERTLHLDTDTIVVTTELDQVFEALGSADLGMVETAVDDSYSRVNVGRRMFNAGLILYRRNERVWAWLRRWAELSSRNFSLASSRRLPPIAILNHVSDEQVKRKLLCMDQVSLVELLSPEHNQCRLNIQVLDYSWNHRGSRLDENNGSPPRILHNPRASPHVHEEKLRSAFERWHQCL
jgi:hypothetical protein